MDSEKYHQHCLLVVNGVLASGHVSGISHIDSIPWDGYSGRLMMGLWKTEVWVQRFMLLKEVVADNYSLKGSVVEV